MEVKNARNKTFPLKFVDTKIVFSEVPDEISLAINFSNCPIHCFGCHSQELWKDVGIQLTVDNLSELLKNNIDVSCICLLGGDLHPEAINEIAYMIKNNMLNIASERKDQKKLKIAWYSGRDKISKHINLDYFDYIKIGSYKESLGGLNCKTTNQCFYKKIEEVDYNHVTKVLWKDITETFIDK